MFEAPKSDMDLTILLGFTERSIDSLHLNLDRRIGSHLFSWLVQTRRASAVLRISPKQR